MTETATPAAARSLPRIRALADVLSNQIAAGEVVERPASVVKELIENSLDASARRIEVEVEAGGVALVRVRDDGCGIHPEDLKLALSRHATSKIASLSDLERIRSFGFRGEALPSIASVSRLTLGSRTGESDSGFEVVAEGAAADGPRPAALPPGTLVSVRDLFYNTPARRKFLRSERTEFRHLEDVVKRAALARFDVGFSFHHNRKELFRLAAARDANGRRQRIVRLLGAAFADQALELDMEGPEMTLKGWIGAPGAARAHPDLQYFYINGRAVRDAAARHAVRQAFGERLAPGRHPAYLLYLDLDPYQVDVNVHPSKLEVRFHQSRLVHDFIWRAVARALDDDAALPPSSEPAAARGRGEAGAAGAIAAGGGNLREWQALYRRDQASGAATRSVPGVVSAISVGQYPTVIGGRYAVRLADDGLTVVDLARARRAMILRDLEAASAGAESVARPLLLPLRSGVEEALADRLESKQDWISSVGFDLRRSGPASMTLRAVPICLAQVPAALLVDVILRWAQGDTDSEALAQALARVGAEQRDDLVKDAQAVSALVRFAEALPADDHAGAVMRLGAAAIAKLMQR